MTHSVTGPVGDRLLERFKCQVEYENMLRFESFRIWLRRGQGVLAEPDRKRDFSSFSSHLESAKRLDVQVCPSFSANSSNRFETAARACLVLTATTRR